MEINIEKEKNYLMNFQGNSHKNQVMILLQLIMLFLFTTNFLVLNQITLPIMNSGTPDNTVESAAPLLLNSGFTQAKTADVKYILWFEEVIPKSVIEALPQKGWNWEQKEMTSDSRKAITLVGSKIISQAEERAVEGSFLKLKKIVNQAGGSAFLDERINQAIDIAAYLSTFKAMPKQWSFIQKTKSITAFQENLGTGIRAGSDIVNVQMLTRASKDSGKTVLAIPVLLEEF